MERFWDEFNRSTITSGLLAIIIWGVIGYLAITGQPIPDALIGAGSMIVGYFFKSKSDSQLTRMMKDIQAHNTRECNHLDRLPPR